MKKHKYDKKDIIRVIALFVVVLMLAVIPLMFVGCAEADPSDGKSTTYAILVLPDGEKIEGEVERAYYYTSGMVDVTIEGVKYKVHGNNIAIITE